MSAAELGFRLGRQLQRRIEAVTWFRVYRQVATRADGASIELLNDRLQLLFPGKFEREFCIAEYRRPSARIGEVGMAAGSFPVLELSSNLAAPDIDWHQDPKSRKSWPICDSDSIDIRDATTIGEVDYVWRVNRCHHFAWLAQVSFLSRNAQLRRDVLGQMERWIRSNPYRRGVNWASSMELAIRCISWLLALTFLSQDEALPSPLLRKISDSIRLQADYVYHHLSRYSSANNHLIVELTGLFSVGLAFQDDTRGERWLRFALAELAREVERQVYPDGVDKEQSTHYHSLVLDCLLWVIVLGERAGLAIPESIRQRAEAMCIFIASVMDTQGHVPSIGDSDDGYLLWLSDMEHLNNYRSQLATGAVLFNRPDLKSAAQFFDEKSFWLLGTEGYDRFQRLVSPSAVRDSTAFPEAGYYVLRSAKEESETLMLFDCGPLGYPSTAAHGHADALSICLSVGGSPVLVDSGTFTYLLYPQWREYFRSTAAHNTVEVNGSSQSETGGPYIWVKQARTHCDTWYSSPSFDYVVANHDGYVTRYGVNHLRRILFAKPHYWIVEDCLTGTAAFRASAFFHFAQGEATVTKTATHHVCRFVSQSDAAGVEIIVLGGEALEAELLSGEEPNTQGWISTRYARKVRAPVLQLEVKSRQRHRLSYLIIPRPRTSQADRGRSSSGICQPVVTRSPGYTRCTIASDHYCDDIYFVEDPNIRLQSDKLVVGAQSVVIRSIRGERIVSICLIEPSDARWDGRKMAPLLVSQPLLMIGLDEKEYSTADPNNVRISLVPAELSRTEVRVLRTWN